MVARLPLTVSGLPVMRRADGDDRPSVAGFGAVVVVVRSPHPVRDW
jgi:hypothetical protein